jgi:hypothetical protein
VAPSKNLSNSFSKILPTFTKSQNSKHHRTSNHTSKDPSSPQLFYRKWRPCPLWTTHLECDIPDLRNTNLERIRREARTLSPEQRETLLAALDFDLRGDAVAETAESEITDAWDTEIQQRVTDVESGKVDLLSYTQFISVFDEARTEMRSQKQGSYDAAISPGGTRSSPAHVPLLGWRRREIGG